MKKKRNYLILPVLTILLLNVVPWGTCEALMRIAPEDPSLIRLSWTQDPRYAMTVTWQDSANAQRAWVEYVCGTEESLETARRTDPAQILVQEAVQVEHTSTLSDGGTQWTATLTGLQPGSSYTCQIKSENLPLIPSGKVKEHSSEVISFVTRAEKKEDSLAFAYFGDVQVNQEAEGEFSRWGQLAQDALERNPDLQFGIMGGDIVESGISTEQFDMFFDAASPVFSRIPLFPANGNHESNFLSGKPELYLDSFTLPENGPEEFKEEFYSFDAGPAHIMVLNSWVYSGEQKLGIENYKRISEWIRQDLDHSDALWKIAVMHHPLYAVHNDRVADLVKEHWGTVLQAGGVRLLLCGHQHVYCRSVPLTDGRLDEEHGITQVMGVSGEKFYSSADELNMERTIYGVSNYQVLHVNSNSLEIQCFDKEGRELDYAVLSASDNENTQEGAERFTDVTEIDWFRDAVDYVVRKGFFNGVSEVQYAPRQMMTRAMFATVLSRLDGKNTLDGDRQVFRDVPPGQWYSAGIAWAAEHGIVSGVGDGCFDPEGCITREQMAVMMYRYAVSRQEDTEAAQERLSGFSDRDDLSGYAVEGMNWCVDRGIINGPGDGRLAPRSNASRAEVAQIIRNYEEREKTT